MRSLVAIKQRTQRKARSSKFGSLHATLATTTNTDMFCHTTPRVARTALDCSLKKKVLNGANRVFLFGGAP